MAELADALDLGSSVFDVGVRVPSCAPCSPALSRWGDRGAAASVGGFSDAKGTRFFREPRASAVGIRLNSSDEGQTRPDEDRQRDECGDDDDEADDPVECQGVDDVSEQ